MSTSPSLLIYIPSFNRWDSLEEKINILLPQLDGINSKLVISNNCSTDKSYNRLDQFVQDDLVEVINLTVNTGIAGNILHAFEVKFGDFLWILSDDDTIYHNSVDLLLNELSFDLDLIYLFAGVKGEENISSDTHITNKRDFFSKFTHCSMTGLISANVYNKHKILNSVSIGYEYANTLFPHTAMFLNQIRSADQIKIKTLRNVVQWHFGKRTYDSTYYRAWVYFLDLAELVEPKYRYLAVRKFLADWALSHYLPISFSSGHFLKYIYYSLKNFRLLPYFIFYLLVYPLYKALKTTFKLPTI